MSGGSLVSKIQASSSLVACSLEVEKNLTLDDVFPNFFIRVEYVYSIDGVHFSFHSTIWGHYDTTWCHAPEAVRGQGWLYDVRVSP